jgi:hypothetical protein
VLPITVAVVSEVAYLIPSTVMFSAERGKVRAIKKEMTRK